MKLLKNNRGNNVAFVTLGLGDELGRLKQQEKSKIVVLALIL